MTLTSRRVCLALLASCVQWGCVVQTEPLSGNPGPPGDSPFKVTDDNAAVYLDGNVGVGTDSPTDPLQIQADDAGRSLGIVGRNADSYSSVAFRDASGTNEFMLESDGSRFSMSGGYVGIGTAEPATGFHVWRAGDPPVGDSGFRGVGHVRVDTDQRSSASDYDPSNTVASTILAVSGAENDLNKASTIALSQFNAVSTISSLYTATNRSVLSFATSRGAGEGLAGSPVEALRIDDTGNLVFGFNQQPSTKLYKAFATDHEASNAPTDLCLGISDGAGEPVGICVLDTRNAADSFNDQWIEFSTHQGGVGAGVRMAITPDGNVGIGTTTPKGREHVVGDLVLGLDQDDRRFIFTPRTGFEGEFIQLTCDDENGEWQWSQGLTVHRGGNVGIGTNAPVATLDVNGTARLAKYSSPPFTCDPAHDGTIALTSKYLTCVCNGPGNTWVKTSDGTPPCAWQ